MFAIIISYSYNKGNMPYANEGNLENYLTIDVDNSFSSQITDWAEAVDLYIDKYTNRSFADSGSEVRYFDGNGGREIDIDIFSSLSSVQILGVTSDDVSHTLTEGKENDYIIYPYNDNPKYRLILTKTSAVQAWPTSPRRIKITGSWGETAVPKDIELAATILLAGIVEKGLKGGTVLSEDLGDYSVTFKNVDDISSVMGVKDILDKYKLYTL